MSSKPRTGGTPLRRWGIRFFEALRDGADWFAANPIILREFIRQARGFRFWILMAVVLTGGSAALCLVWGRTPASF